MYKKTVNGAPFVLHVGDIYLHFVSGLKHEHDSEY